MRVIKPVQYLHDMWDTLYEEGTFSGYLDDGTPGTPYTAYPFLPGSLYEEWVSTKAFPVGTIVWWFDGSNYQLYKAKTNQPGTNLADPNYWEHMGRAYYDSTYSYKKGVVVVYKKKLYESLMDSNLNNEPGLDTTKSKWLDLGTDNRVALFDVYLTRPSISRTNFSTQIYPNVLQKNNITIDSIGISRLKNITSIKVSIWQLNSTPVWKMVWSNTYLVTGKSTALLTGIPYSPAYGPYDKPSSKILLEFTVSGTDTAEVGTVVFGTVNTLGQIDYGASLGITDYSVKELNEYGDALFVKRSYNRSVSVSFNVNNSSVAQVQQLLYDIRATPTYWEVTDISDFSSITNFVGWYTDFNCEISRPTVSTYSLELQSLR